jgi:hypothetical protein
MGTYKIGKLLQHNMPRASLKIHIEIKKRELFNMGSVRPYLT